MPNKPTLPDGAFTGAAAWIGSELSEDAGIVVLNPEALKEIAHLAATLSNNPLPALALDPDDFDLPACGSVMAKAQAALNDGLGFAIIDRIPIDTMPREIAVKVYWLLARMVARPVAQKWSGEMIYTVADLTGKKPGNGIRPDITNAEQNFHNDNSYNLCPPDYVGLLCLQVAKSGGISRVVSRSDRSSPITCRSPPQHGQTLLSGSITTSSRGRCAGR